MATDSRKVKLLCSYGGNILPRPSDGALRYAGGHTRMLSLRRSSTLEDFMHKISLISEGTFTAVKYQLPDEDLDALILVSSQEDFDNMMEEFDRVNEASNDGSARIRIFLFTLSDIGDPSEAIHTGQSYIEAVNGVGIRRKNSLVSASSSEGMSPLILSPTHLSVTQDSSRFGGFREEALIVGRIENQNVNSGNVHPVYVSAGTMVSVGGNADRIQGKTEPLCGAGDHLGNFGDNLIPIKGKLESLLGGGNQMSSFGAGANSTHNQGKVEYVGVNCDHMSNFGGNLMTNQGRVEENFHRADQNSNSSNCSGYNNGYHHQPLNQLQLLHPTYINQLPKSYVPPLRQIPHQTLRLEDHELCQKSLAHAHSDTLLNEHSNGNGSGMIQEPRPVLQSHRSEDPARQQVSIRPDNVIEPKIQVAGVAASLYSHQLENERVFHPNVEALHPPGVATTADPARLLASLTGAAAESAPKIETVSTGGQFGSCGLAPEIMHLHEKENLVHPKAEVFDLPKVLHPRTAVSGALAGSGAESKIDNVAAPSQIGAHVFTQPPNIPQQHDNEKLLIDLDVPAPAPAPAVVGLPGDTQASHGVFANPKLSHFLDPFQTMSHNVVQPHNLVKQDVVTKQFCTDASLAMNGIFKAAEPTSRVTGPEIPYDHVRPINGMMESHQVSTFEPSGTPEHVRPAAMVNLEPPMLNTEDFALLVEKTHAVRPSVEGNGVFLGNPHFMSGIVPEGNSIRPVTLLSTSSAELKPEHRLAASDNNQIFRSQAGGNVTYLGNSFITSGIVPEGNSFIPSTQMPPPSLNFTHLQSLQPSETSQASTVVTNHGALLSYGQEMRVQTGVPNEQLHAMPAYTCSATPLYNNNTAINVEAIGDWKNETSWLQSKDMLSRPLNGNVPINNSNTTGRDGDTDEFQGPKPSGSLFCNHDPRKNVGNMQMVPPMPNKVSSREFATPVDLCTENHLVNSKGVEEGAFQHLPIPTNKLLCTEPVQSMQGEENNKHEVQGLAEQVMTTVHQPTVHPAPVRFPRERGDYDLQANQESVLGEANAFTTSVAAVDNNRIEGLMTKQTDKMKFGFPITDGIGGLQIIKNGDLEELRELGSGTFGTVYHGKWRGSDVAIKRINDRCFAGKLSEEERMRADFWNEACNLADLHHPNIVAFYGVVLDGPGGSFATVTEFMVNGSLRRALQKNDKILDKRRRVLIAMDVAFGMEYLHGKNMIHFDLKSDNLLVNLRDPQRPICKVADLGLSKVKRQTLISGGVRGTLPWMAPELLNGGDSMVSNKVDVFSYGIVMWELLTGEEPYADLHYGAIIGGIVSNSLRPAVPETCDPEWRSLMEQCWSPESSERPSFMEIASRLRAMAASLPPK